MSRWKAKLKAVGRACGVLLTFAGRFDLHARGQGLIVCRARPRAPAHKSAQSYRLFPLGGRPIIRCRLAVFLEGPGSSTAHRELCLYIRLQYSCFVLYPGLLSGAVSEARRRRDKTKARPRRRASNGSRWQGASLGAEVLCRTRSAALSALVPGTQGGCGARVAPTGGRGGEGSAAMTLQYGRVIASTP